MALTDKRIACASSISKITPRGSPLVEKKVRAEAGSENEKRQPFVMAGVVIEC